MAKVIIEKEISKCSECDNCNISPIPTNDSWERPEKWECRIVTEDGRLKVIDGYHDWYDKTPVPDWCPIMIK